MVLFNDTEPKGKPSLFGQIIKWLFRLTLVIVCFIAFFIGVLNLLHGKGEAQRRGLEGAATDITGYRTAIGTLNEFKLFPRLIIDVDDVTLGDPETGRLIAHVDHFRFVAPGAIVLSRSNRFHTFDIKAMTFYKNGLPMVAIETAGVRTDTEEDGETSELVMEGRIQKTEPFAFTLALETLYDAEDKSLYAPAEHLPFTLRQGKDAFQGRIYSNENGAVLSGTGEFIAEKTAEAEQISVSCLMGELRKQAGGVALERLILIDSDYKVASGKGTYSPVDGWNFYLDPSPEGAKPPLDAVLLQDNDPCREALSQ